MLAPFGGGAVHISRIGWASIGLAVLAAVVQAVIVKIIVNRRQKGNFPIFLSYSCFGVIMVAVALAGYLFSSCAQYFYLYWVLSFLYMALEFGVMYEIFVNALKPYSALIDLGKMLFRWAAVFLLFAGILTALATAGSQANRLVAAVALVERSMRLMQCGLLLLFFFFERRLGLSWRNHNMAIALGLGAGAAMDLSVSYLKAHYPASSDAFGIVNSVFYLGVVCFWASNLSQTEPARSNVLDSPSRLIFQRWNEALTSYSVRGEMVFASSGVESFLPGVEQTVDRVLARKIVQ
jgi:hypothetical protein